MQQFLNNQTKKKTAFTLLELMLVVTIIGILAIIAIPGYKNYVIRSKVAETYTIIGATGKNQLTYFLENKEFVNAFGQNPVNLEAGSFTSVSSWNTLGMPVPIGTPVTFSYRSVSGKIDSSGTELTLGVDSVSGEGFSLLSFDATINTRHLNGTPCNSGAATPESLGLSASNNYDWNVTAGMADLNGDYGEDCTAVVRILESSNTNDKKPAFVGGFITLNLGE